VILGVDGLRLLGMRAGVGRAVEAILRSLDGVEHPFDEIRVYTPRPLSADVDLPRGARSVVAGGRLPNGVWQQLVLSRLHGRTGLLLCPSYVVPLLASSPTFLIHHGSYEGYPQAFPFWARTKSRWLNAASARRATAMSTVSEHSKRDIVRYYGVAPAKVAVVPEGVDTALFRPMAGATAVKEWQRAALGHNEPFIMYVGKPSPRRNVAELIRAFVRLKRAERIPQRLVLFGTALPGTPVAALINELGANDMVDTIGHASHADLALAYNAADLLVYPSSYEGFGMPVLEAMACGLPAVALDNTAFPEFAGGVARLLPDAEVETLREGILGALGDEAWRAEARRAGPERAARYDWRLVTAHYVELMVQAAGRPS
jgi:glycosyltransferase involved in cell wall biosynthesis